MAAVVKGEIWCEVKVKNISFPCAPVPTAGTPDIRDTLEKCFCVCVCVYEKDSVRKVEVYI